MKKTILFLVGLIGITAITIAGPDKVKAKIEKMNKAMAESMISGDYNSTIDMNAEDVISMPNYGPMVKGIEAVKKSNEEMSKSGMKVLAFSLDIMKIMSEGDLFVEMGTYTMEFSMGEGQQPMTDKGKYITIWEKNSEGELKIKAGIWNTDSNPWAGHEM